MSRLEFYSRPLVAFDPSSKEHRRIYYAFVKTRTWGHSPVRFICPEDHGDLITMIQRNLIDYYVRKEFGMIVPEAPQPLVRQKRKKTVDNATKK
jgi:hypothetical protein